MSSIWFSNKTKVESDGSDLFYNRGTRSIQGTGESVFATVCQSNDHSGIFYNKQSTLALDGFIHNTSCIEILNSIHNLSSLKEVANTLSGDYALVVETPNFFAGITDPWKTKQLWIATDGNHFAFSSSPDLIRKHFDQAYPVDPNTIIVIDKKDFKVSKFKGKYFNLTQTDSTHSKVFDAFENALKVRYNQHCVSTLSSGYDSGAIACGLAELGHTKFSCSFSATEDKAVLEKRLDKHNGTILTDRGQFTDKEVEDLNSLYMQPEIIAESGEAIGRICRHLKKIGKSVILSGNGGDEMYSDYGFNKKQFGLNSYFGGYFPSDLSVAWPWHDYSQRQSSLVSRIDLLGGYYGIQHMEPLLDVGLVQAWLNTTAELKNKRYKHWMFEYMTEHDYPMLENVKIGFGNSGTQRQI